MTLQRILIVLVLLFAGWFMITTAKNIIATASDQRVQHEEEIQSVKSTIQSEK